MYYIAKKYLLIPQTTNKHIRFPSNVIEKVEKSNTKEAIKFFYICYSCGEGSPKEHRRRVATIITNSSNAAFIFIKIIYQMIAFLKEKELNSLDY